MFSSLRPSPTLSSRDVRSSLRLMTAEGLATEGFFSLTSGEEALRSVLEALPSELTDISEDKPWGDAGVDSDAVT